MTTTLNTINTKWAFKLLSRVEWGNDGRLSEITFKIKNIAFWSHVNSAGHIYPLDCVISGLSK